MKIIDDYFIKQKLNKLRNPVIPLEINKELADVKSIYILWSDNIEQVTSFLPIVESIKKHYGIDPVILVDSFALLYKDISKFEIKKISMPVPTKFAALDEFVRIRKAEKRIDMYFDFSRSDERIRAMIRRTLNPKISVSSKHMSMHDEYNIIAAAENNLQLLKMMGIDTVSASAENIMNRAKGIVSTAYNYVLIGESLSVKRRARGLMSSENSILYINNLRDKLTLKHALSIGKSTHIIHDRAYTSDIDFIKKLFK